MNSLNSNKRNYLKEFKELSDSLESNELLFAFQDVYGLQEAFTKPGQTRDYIEDLTRQKVLPEIKGEELNNNILE